MTTQLHAIAPETLAALRKVVLDDVRKVGPERMALACLRLDDVRDDVAPESLEHRIVFACEALREVLACAADHVTRILDVDDHAGECRVYSEELVSLAAVARDLSRELVTLAGGAR